MLYENGIANQGKTHTVLAHPDFIFRYYINVSNQIQRLRSLSSQSQQVAPLNGLGIDVACIGNHDFDFGVAVLRSHIAQIKFPWLLSNVVDPDTDKPLGGGKKFVVFNKSGLKIGVIGLVEKYV